MVELVIMLLLSALLSALLGFERELSHKPAGLRTHILVGVGSAVFTYLSLHAFPGADPSRVAAYILAGIGFIGAGTIIQTRENVQGITTAASLWLTAAVGMACGAQQYLLAALATIVGVLTLFSRKVTKRVF